MSKNPIIAAVVGVALGVGATLGIGLPSGLLVTGKAAEEMVQTAAVDSLVPLCVAKFKKTPEAKSLLVQLKGMNPWSRANFVKDKGWGTIAGAEVPADQVADACAVELVSLDR